MFIFQKKELRVNQLDDAGMYTAKIMRANLNKKNTAIGLTLSLNEIYTEPVWIVLKTKQKLDNDFGLSLLNDIVYLLNIDDLSSKTTRLEQLKNKEIGVLLNISENKEYRNISLLAVYDLDTHQTAFEKANDLEAKFIYKKCDELEALHESN